MIPKKREICDTRKHHLQHVITDSKTSEGLIQTKQLLWLFVVYK